MKIYWGNVAKLDILDYMKEHNYGQMITSPYFRTPKANYYALDNGAYSNWKNHKEFDSKGFLKFLRKYENRDIEKPDWIAVPDKVAEGQKSLEFSLNWLDKISDYFDKRMLVVQDGMDPKKVEDNINKFYGLFVGGSKRWKIDSTPQWVNLAHKYDKICHVGRISRWNEIMWAKRIGVDSIDSTTWPQNFKTDGHMQLEYAEMQEKLDVKA